MDEDRGIAARQTNVEFQGFGPLFQAELECPHRILRGETRRTAMGDDGTELRVQKHVMN
jgi:hypothetical protein